MLPREERAEWGECHGKEMRPPPSRSHLLSAPILQCLGLHGSRIQRQLERGSLLRELTLCRQQTRKGWGLEVRRLVAHSALPAWAATQVVCDSALSQTNELPFFSSDQLEEGAQSLMR